MQGGGGEEGATGRTCLKRGICSGECVCVCRRVCVCVCVCVFVCMCVCACVQCVVVVVCEHNYKLFLLPRDALRCRRIASVSLSSSLDKRLADLEYM